MTGQFFAFSFHSLQSSQTTCTRRISLSSYPFIWAPLVSYSADFCYLFHYRMTTRFHKGTWAELNPFIHAHRCTFNQSNVTITSAGAEGCCQKGKVILNVHLVLLRGGGGKQGRDAALRSVYTQRWQAKSRGITETRDDPWQCAGTAGKVLSSADLRSCYVTDRAERWMSQKIGRNNGYMMPGRCVSVVEPVIVPQPTAEQDHVGIVVLSCIRSITQCLQDEMNGACKSFPFRSWSNHVIEICPPK